MKLSEAIRFGEFALSPVKGHGWFDFKEGADTPCGGCAVGRMLYAMGYKPTARWEQWKPMTDFVETLWPWTRIKCTIAPPNTRAGECLGIYHSRLHILNRISDLYEGDNWSMTQIADWVATIEPQDVATIEPIMESQCVSR